MALLSVGQRTVARAVARLHATNPFTEDRVALEAAALGARFRPPRRPRARDGDAVDDVAATNQLALEETAAELAEHMRGALARGASCLEEERGLYKEVVFVTLFDRAVVALDDLAARPHRPGARVAAWADHVDAWRRYFDDATARSTLLPTETPALLFALFFQLRRAFTSIYRHLVGTSAPMITLRAAVWRSVFTVDPARYRRALVGRMSEVPTLILGETGTGKELVARAIAGATFVPFDVDRQAFGGDHRAFFPISLAELPETLVESALFGHRRGAFTGADVDHKGVFAACPPEGVVFLDEVGELPPAVQVKLLRVLETREASPLGSLERFRFPGRVVAATHRDLDAAARDGRFRLDLLHRLAGDVVTTPALRHRIVADAEELPRLARHLAHGVVGDVEGPALFADVAQALARLPRGYAWPGNVRELAQFVRRVLVQGPGPAATSDAVMPASGAGAPSLPTTFIDELRAGALPLDDVVDAYIRLVHARTGTVSGTARALGVDRRTVRARVGGVDD
jgi:DNA-binding NtrC family response regulator